MIPQEMRLEIVTPNGVALCEMVRYVQIPVENGSLGVLPGHTAMMVAVGTGVLKYQGENKEDYLAVSDGFAEVDNDKIIVLTNTAEDAAHIDLARAEAALNRAQERLSHKGKDTDVARAEASLRRAMARINASRRR